MSKCISRCGEYSEHDPDEEYFCTRCGALDEDGLRIELRALRKIANANGEPPPAGCLDCGIRYGAFGLDVHVPHSQWMKIHPDEHGLLCALCIVRRASHIKGATVAHLIIETEAPE